MNAEDFLATLAIELKSRKDLDPQVAAEVIERLVLDDDPMERVDAVEVALYKTAMRRARGK